MKSRWTIHIHPQEQAVKPLIEDLPRIFSTEEGEIIRRARNELRILEYQGKRYVVKSFALPKLPNRWIYGNLRSGKAQRSYEYAQMLLEHGIGSPRPIAWSTEQRGLNFGRSYFVCLCSECPHTFEDIMNGHLSAQDEHDYLVAIGRTVARMHQCGYLHHDLSRGNILLGRRKDGSIQVEIIDLNRIRFRKISLAEGLSNLFERLPVNSEQHRIMEEAYRQALQSANP